MAGRHPFKAQQRDTRAHGVIGAYLDRYGLDSGHEEFIPGIPAQVADEARRSIHRGARHHGCRASVGVRDQGDGTAALVFALWSPDRARQYVLEMTGGDPAKLAYNPYAKAVARGRHRS